MSVALFVPVGPRPILGWNPSRARQVPLSPGHNPVALARADGRGGSGGYFIGEDLRNDGRNRGRNCLVGASPDSHDANSTSSTRVPAKAFGCTKATAPPRLSDPRPPRRGFSSTRRAPSALR